MGRQPEFLRTGPAPCVRTMDAGFLHKAPQTLSHTEFRSKRVTASTVCLFFNREMFLLKPPIDRGKPPRALWFLRVRSPRTRIFLKRHRQKPVVVAVKKKKKKNGSRTVAQGSSKVPLSPTRVVNDVTFSLRPLKSQDRVRTTSQANANAASVLRKFPRRRCGCGRLNVKVKVA